MLTHDNICVERARLERQSCRMGRTKSRSASCRSRTSSSGGRLLFFATGVTIAYAESIDTVPFNMKEVRPHDRDVGAAAVREDVCARARERVSGGAAQEADLLLGARASADRWADVKLAGREPGGLLAHAVRARAEARLLQAPAAHRRATALLRLGRRTAGAEINKFFYAAGLTILEGYGLTETSPGDRGEHARTHFRIGTVGQAGRRRRGADRRRTARS